MVLKYAFPLRISLVLLSVALAICAIYTTLMPYWLVQSGEKKAANETTSRVYYSQGIGIWMNYTEHVGDPDFDPGNSLWIPPQQSGVETFTMQCASTRTFCNNAVGELHRQYCEVMDVYCGITMRVLQYAMSVMCGIALLIAIWTIFLVFSSHRSIIDIYLMQLCIFNGIGYLGIACLWYLTVYRAIISTTFYKDQYVRCLENPSSRKCWHIGSCLYVMGSSTFLYPILSMLTASYVGVKFRNYQHRLRNLLEQITTVELPAPSMAMKSQTQQRPHDHAISKSKATSNEHHVTTLLTSNAGMEIDMAAIQLQSGNKLASLEHIPSTMSAINVNDLDRVVLSDGEEKEENDRSEITARVSSPRSLKKKKSKRRKK